MDFAIYIANDINVTCNSLLGMTEHLSRTQHASVEQQQIMPIARNICHISMLQNQSVSLSAPIPVLQSGVDSWVFSGNLVNVECRGRF